MLNGLLNHDVRDIGVVDVRPLEAHKLIHEGAELVRVKVSNLVVDIDSLLVGDLELEIAPGEIQHISVVAGLDVGFDLIINSCLHTASGHQKSQGEKKIVFIKESFLIYSSTVYLCAGKHNNNCSSSQA